MIERKRVLIVDDNQDLCENIRDVLAGKSYRVNTAHTGEEAIRQVRENAFAIILLDLKLPTLNGLETYLAVRDLRPDIVAILITGFGRELGDLSRQALDKNAYVCLEKPIDMDKLLKLLARIEEQKRRGDTSKPNKG